MKILNINTFDNYGGAARGAFRLHSALRKSGIDSQLLVQRMNRDETNVIGAENFIEEKVNRFQPILDSIPVRFYRNRNKMLFSPSWISSGNLLKKIARIDPDIVHLHWINAGFFKIEDLAKINKPIVWTLRDNWPFTGGCHIMWSCEKYTRKCGACPTLGSEKENDLSRWVWNRKQQTLENTENITFVGLSNWISNCAKESSLLKGKKILTIPNIIDIDEFKPQKKEIAREDLGLPTDKKIILFGAYNAVSDKNKGYEDFIYALGKLQIEDIEVVVFGNKEENQPNNPKFKIHYKGIVNDDEQLIKIYNSADLMVVPSLQESFGNTAAEAMSCGVPVVAYGSSGLLDIVDHKKNGYLAKPFQADDLTNGIQWVFENSEKLNLSFEARKKVERFFCKKVVVEKYLNLYQEIMDNMSTTKNA